MKGQIQKFGNSLGIYIPKAYAEALQWNHRTRVNAALVDGKLVIETAEEPGVTLEELLEGVTLENLQEEVDTGPSAGNENW